jgi:hypothetical protein
VRRDVSSSLFFRIVIKHSHLHANPQSPRCASQGGSAACPLLMLIGWDRPPAADPIRRIRLRRDANLARFARHDHDQTIPPNFHTSDAQPRRLNGFCSSGQICFFEGGRAPHKASKCTSFASSH